MNTNQYPNLLVHLQREAARTQCELRDGVSPSQIASRLHADGLATIHIMAVFMHATGLPLSRLKELGRWWGPNGVTDSIAFDERAQELLRRLSIDRPLE